MKEKLLEAKNEFVRQIRNISITFNLAVYLMYIAYLGYALDQGIGIKEVNIALIIGTALFLIIYIALRTVGSGSKKGLKATKKFYKRFKLTTKVFSVGTSLYAVVTAQSAISPIARILAYLGAALLILRLITELITSAAQRSAKRIKKKFKESAEERKERKAMKEIERELGEVDDLCAITPDDLD